MPGNWTVGGYRPLMALSAPGDRSACGKTAARSTARLAALSGSQLAQPGIVEWVRRVVSGNLFMHSPCRATFGEK